MPWALLYRKYRLATVMHALTIRLSATSTQLNETVVTGNAIKEKKEVLGYSTTTIGADELGKGGSVSPTQLPGR